MLADDCLTKVCLCGDNLVTEAITKRRLEGFEKKFLIK
jgi:hypothetical protein